MKVETLSENKVSKTSNDGAIQKKGKCRAREMSQGLEHWLLLQMTWDQFPAPTWWFIVICNFSFKGSSAFF